MKIPHESRSMELFASAYIMVMVLSNITIGVEEDPVGREELSSIDAVGDGIKCVALPPPGYTELCAIGPGFRSRCEGAVKNADVVVGYVELLRRPMEEAGRECEFFTMMRHPIDRLVSAFFYCPGSRDVQARPLKWCGEEPHEEELTDRLVSFAMEDWKCKAMYQLNLSSYCPPGAFCAQTITPRPPTILEGGADWKALAYAEEALLNYTAIGIFEEWELSMQLFDATVHSPVQRWTTSEAVNLGPQSARREALARWAHTSSEIRKAVAGDLLLYDLSLSIFKKQTTEVLGTVWHGGGTNT